MPSALYTTRVPATNAQAISLNEQQQHAAEHAGSPLIVLAGPGTGKTRVIIARVARLLNVDCVDPESILAVTFTVKAAEQMRARLAEACGRAKAERVNIHTFHGYGYRLMTRFGDLIGVHASPQIIDSAQSRRLLRRLVVEHDLFPGHRAMGPDAVVPEVQHFVDVCRQCARYPADALAYARAWRERLAEAADDGSDEAAAERARCDHFGELARAYELYDAACMERGLLSFEHYLTLPIRILRESADAAATVRSEVRHVVVDEFQDVNAAQIELLREIAPPERNPDICVVGDDDQSIYGFRGSDPRAFRHFAETWEGSQTVRLEKNYRSSPSILEVTNAFVHETPERFEPDKGVHAAGENAKEPGEPIRLITTTHKDDAGALIGAMIERECAESGRKHSDFAVITRTRNQLDMVAQHLEVAGIRFTFRRQYDLREDDAVRDVLAWIMLLVGASEEPSVLRLLVRPPIGVALATARGWVQSYRAEASRGRGKHGGRTVVDWLRENVRDEPGVGRFLAMHDELAAAAGTHTADRVVFQVIRQTGLAEFEPLRGPEQARRIEHLAQMVRFVRTLVPRLDPPGDLHAFWEYYNDLDDSEQSFRLAHSGRIDAGDEEAEGPDTEEGAVTLLTAHSAKGLEFDTVFLPYVRKRGFPASPRAEEFEPIPEEFTGVPGLEHMTEERRLFYVAMTRAERRLVLLAEQRKGKADDFFTELSDKAGTLPVVPLDESDVLEEALGARDELQREADAVGSPEDDALASARREARQAIFSHLHRIYREDLDAPAMENALDGLRREAIRLGLVGHAERHADGPAPFAGVVDERNEAFARALRERLNARAAAPLPNAPKAPLHLSFTAIDLYGRCPRCYLARMILHLPEEVPVQVVVGSVVHKALEKFYLDFASRTSEGQPAPTREDLLELGDRYFEAEWPRSMPRDEGQHRQVRALLANAYERLHSDDLHVLEVERKVESVPVVVDGEEHYLTAKIDRIDQFETAEGIAYRLVDYKTGHPSKRFREPKKQDLQMGIYARALSALFDSEEVPPGVAEYWLLASGESGCIGLSELDMGKIDDQITKAVRGILAGEFERGSRCSGACELLGSSGS